MKKFLLHSLLRTYSYITIFIIIFFATIISYSNYRNRVQSIDQIERQIVTRITEELNHYQRRLQSELYSLSSDVNKLEGISNYFELSDSDYQVWLRRHSLSQFVELSLYKNINNIYFRNDFVEGIDIALIDKDYIFSSTRSLKSGHRISSKNYKAPNNALLLTIYNNSTSELFATVFVSINTNRLSEIIKSETDIPISLDIKDNLDRKIFQYLPITEDLVSQKQLEGGLIMEIGVPKAYIFNENIKWTFFIFFFSLIIALILLLVLNRIFYRYRTQVSDIVESIQTITYEDSNARIDITSKEQELYIVSDQINQMLDSLDTNLKEIYQLQIAQKDADMRALQAQINPHFLYNTLEFFRMYAVTKDQEELADMIYEFATLLRGSISQESLTTIKEELSFCEKHSYICQMRYPKTIAYAYQIEDGCQNLVLPRFCIQPLVENYFAHGLDLRKKTNALSVKVLKKSNDIEIIVKDNGKGMPEETLQKYQKLLSSRELSDYNASKSIGLLNVHERLLLHFGDSYSMKVEETEGGGVTYKMIFEGVLREIEPECIS